MAKAASPRYASVLPPPVGTTAGLAMASVDGCGLDGRVGKAGRLSSTNARLKRIPAPVFRDVDGPQLLLRTSAQDRAQRGCNASRGCKRSLAPPRCRSSTPARSGPGLPAFSARNRPPHTPEDRVGCPRRGLFSIPRRIRSTRGAAGGESPRRFGQRLHVRTPPEQRDLRRGGRSMRRHRETGSRWCESRRRGPTSPGEPPRWRRRARANSTSRR